MSQPELREPLQYKGIKNMKPDSRWRCDECSKVWDQVELLTAPNPFDPTDSICGCPNCKAIDCFTLLCDEPGCARQVSCGWPSQAGYRSTCYNHGPHTN